MADKRIKTKKKDSIQFPVEVGKKWINGKNLSYLIVKEHYPKFVPITQFNPEKYDLVQLKDEEDKLYIGWYTGSGYDGLKINRNTKITEWKKIYDLHDSME